MKKIFLVIFVSLFFVGISLLFSLNFFRQKVGDIRPAILPPKTTSSPPKLLSKISQISQMKIFASNLSAPRDLEFSPGGTLLASIPTEGKIVALPDKDKDGKADQVKVILSNLDKPHGIAFYNGELFVAEETQVKRYFWDEKDLSAKLDKKLFDLPVGGNHRTRSIAFDKNGRMFVSIGSTCNVCVEKDERLASVIVSDFDGNNPHVFAKGLRNSVFITINPKTEELWGTEMGRDFLGDDTPPDEINILEEGKDYGWPYCYDNQIHDDNFDPKKIKQCDQTKSPAYKIQAHSAPLGLVFINSKKFPDSWQGDLFVSYHGSWNRSIPTGYKVVHLKVDVGKITSEEDFITGFLQGAQAIGRPVDLIFDVDGSLYISDDKAGVIYKFGT